jgi:hypothetical protein
MPPKSLLQPAYATGRQRQRIFSKASEPEQQHCPVSFTLRVDGFSSALLAHQDIGCGLDR